MDTGRIAAALVALALAGCESRPPPETPLQYPQLLRYESAAGRDPTTVELETPRWDGESVDAWQERHDAAWTAWRTRHRDDLEPVDH